VVHDFNMEIEDGEFISLLGPSGCGKTTILRMIAGLEDISQGELFIDGERYNDVPITHRKISMVFQNYALFPHMTVTQNIAFGLKMAKMPRPDIMEKVDWACDLLSLNGLEKRLPGEISGGQRQRVALGRALVLNPKVLLLDEPLSNLDAHLRTRMTTELKKIHNQLKVTVIYVTHNQFEAMPLSDRMVVMRGGRIEQIGGSQEIYNKPGNTFVAGFIGLPKMNFMAGELYPDPKNPTFKIGEFSFNLDPKKGPILTEGEPRPVIAGVRAQHISEFIKSPHHRTTDSILEGQVEVVEPLGDRHFAVVRVAGQTLEMVLSPDRTIKSGENLEVVFDGRNINIFKADGIQESLLKSVDSK